VQEDERRAVPRLEDLDGGPSGAELDETGAWDDAHAASPVPRSTLLRTASL
jgi:hypothetical protein